MVDSASERFFDRSKEKNDKILNASAGNIIRLAKRSSLGGLEMTKKKSLVYACCKKQKQKTGGITASVYR